LNASGLVWCLATYTQSCWKRTPKCIINERNSILS